MLTRLLLAASALILISTPQAALAQSCEDSATCQELQSNVEPNSDASTDPSLSDENSSYLSGGGFDSAGDTSVGSDDGSDLQPQPFSAEPNE